MQPVLRWLWLVLVSLVLVACSTMNTAGTASQSSTKSPNTSVAQRGRGVLSDGYFNHRPVNPDPAYLAANKQQDPSIQSVSPTDSQEGMDFVPAGDAEAYKATGFASWYGKKFHGRKTSSGERYDMYALTAAHKTMPIPSYAKVTNLKNGKSIIVRVNDRGPYLRHRLIDLSYAAAEKLGFAKQGRVKVHIEQVKPVLLAQAQQQVGVKPVASAKAPAVNPPRQQQAFLQLGSYDKLSSAEAELPNLLKKLSAQYDSKLGIVHDQGIYRIRLGPFDSDKAALQAANSISVDPVLLH